MVPFFSLFIVQEDKISVLYKYRDKQKQTETNMLISEENRKDLVLIQPGKLVELEHKTNGEWETTALYITQVQVGLAVGYPVELQLDQEEGIYTGFNLPNLNLEFNLVGVKVEEITQVFKPCEKLEKTIKFFLGL